MFARTKYVGVYPLGSEFELNHIRIMQAEWKELKIFLIPICFDSPTSPMHAHIYFVQEDQLTTCFLANEFGIGKYHIFSFSEKALTKLIPKCETAKY